MNRPFVNNWYEEDLNKGVTLQRNNNTFLKTVLAGFPLESFLFPKSCALITMNKYTFTDLAP